MKGKISSIAIGAILTVAIGSQAWALGNVNTTLNNNMNRNHQRQTGRDSMENSHNRTTTNRIDNRDYSNRSVNTSTDNRDFGDYSQRTSVDSRDMSDRRVTTTIDGRSWTDNRVDNQRHQSHNFGDGAIVINGEGYKPRVGHENASVQASGTNAYVDNSVSGNFGIGHTTVKGQ